MAAGGRTHVADTETEGRGRTDPELDLIIDRLVRTVREQMQLDVAFVARIQGSRFEFRNVSVSGSDVDVAAGVELPLEATHCSLVVAGREPVVINDAFTDPRASSLPATSVFGIGAYIGVPVMLTGGELYGTLCCIHSSATDKLADRDVRFMRVLADLVASEIEVHDHRAALGRVRRDEVQALMDGDDLAIVYQPIVSLKRGEIRGYEALSRISVEPRRGPDVWFAEAAEVGLGMELECHAIRLALAGFDFSSGAYISVNASPETVLTPQFEECLKGYPAGQLVLEVTEHAQVVSYPLLMEKLEAFRRSGMRLAVDDAGAGFSGLQHILMVKPEIIKLDISLTRGIDEDPIRRSLAIALLSFATELGSQIVAEGVETPEEYQALLDMGIQLGQGYHIARPAPWGAAELNPDVAAIGAAVAS